MRVYLDTEFYEDGQRIFLISIGLVRDDHKTLYLENSEFDWNIVPRDHWLMANVRPHLRGGNSACPRGEIATKVREFVGDEPEFWAYFADYDWIVVCQLYGRMVDLPGGWPWYCRDLKQELDRVEALSCQDIVRPKHVTEHHALADAWWNYQLHLAITAAERSLSSLSADAIAALKAVAWYRLDARKVLDDHGVK